MQQGLLGSYSGHLGMLLPLPCGPDPATTSSYASARVQLPQRVLPGRSPH
jgi:hypothetical protein